MAEELTRNQAIRAFITANPTASPTLISKTLTEQGIAVSALIAGMVLMTVRNERLLEQGAAALHPTDPISFRLVDMVTEQAGAAVGAMGNAMMEANRNATLGDFANELENGLAVVKGLMDECGENALLDDDN